MGNKKVIDFANSTFNVYDSPVTLFQKNKQLPLSKQTFFWREQGS